MRRKNRTRVATGRLIVADGILGWSSLAATLRGLAAGTVERAPGSGASSTKDDDAFRGGSVEDALRLVEAGWPEGTRQVIDALETASRSNVVPAWNLDVAGVMPCVPAYLGGDAECMFTREETPAADARLTLLVPLCYSCYVRPETAMGYATALASVVRALEDVGRSVAVIGYHAVGDSTGKVSVLRVNVREHGEALDLDKLAVTMHPLMLRRLLFAQFEIHAEFPVGARSNGYGSVVELTASQVAEVFPDAGEVARLPVLVREWNSGGVVEAFQRIVPHLRAAVAKDDVAREAA